MTDDDLLRVAREDVTFFSNEHKPDREQWVAAEWLRARGLPEGDLKPGGDPPDLLVNGEGVEIVEVMERGRRRGDEYKRRLGAAVVGDAPPLRSISLSKVREHGHEWILDAVTAKARKYEHAASSEWILLIYANFSWTDRVDWERLEMNLAALSPPFGRVEVLYQVATGAVAKVLYARSRSPKTRQGGGK